MCFPISIYTCYVTEKKKLIGVVDVKDLLTTGENRLIEEIMETNMIYVHTHDDQEEVVSVINKYGLIAVPVVDYEIDRKSTRLNSSHPLSSRMPSSA